jgi:excisionase family DNA binding protein
MVCGVPEPTDLIGSAEVARLLGVSRSTVSRMIRDGYLVPAMRMGTKTGAYLFDPNSLPGGGDNLDETDGIPA